MKKFTVEIKFSVALDNTSSTDPFIAYETITLKDLTLLEVAQLVVGFPRPKQP